MTTWTKPKLHRRSDRDSSLGWIRVTMKGNAAICEWVPEVAVVYSVTEWVLSPNTRPQTMMIYDRVLSYEGITSARNDSDWAPFDTNRVLTHTAPLTGPRSSGGPRRNTGPRSRGRRNR